MLLGSRIEPRPTSSAHNFWLNMIPAIAKDVDQLVIASIGGGASRGVIDGVKFVNMTPFPLQLAYSNRTTGNVRLESNYVFKTMLLGNAFPMIAKLVRRHQIDLVHVIDNYGPIQVGFSLVKAAKTIFQLNYNPRYPLYDELIKLSLKPFDAVITGSFALARRLRELGVSARCEPIPWAISPNLLANPTANTLELRKRFRLDPKLPVVMWTGFIPLVGTREFLFSMRVAKRVTAEFRNVQFIFAFKSEHFDSEYKSFEEQRIRVISLNSRTDFLKLAHVSTLLLCPCLNDRAIVGPPLTWLESMAHGVPVISTQVEGIDEVILNDVNGIVLRETENAHATILKLLHDPRKIERLSFAARETVRKKFELPSALKAYLRIWSFILDGAAS